MIKKVVGLRIINKLRLRQNFKRDLILYEKYSCVFNSDTFEKKEALIVLEYHSIEKGFLHNPIRFRFAKDKIKNLIGLLMDINVLENQKKVHIQSAFFNLCFYYELHLNNNVDISDYYSQENYFFFKERLNLRIEKVTSHTRGSYFSKVNENFFTFSKSRCSVRNFTGELISREKINAVVTLANNAPSVCNRQSSFVYLIENKMIINSILNLQAGFKGYLENVNQLMVLTTNRNYFYTIGERYQFYIDGGIYLMNLLYALHYYQIAACPAHWAKSNDSDIQIMNLMRIPESHKVICVIPIGIPIESFDTTLSLRKEGKENLFIID